MKLPPVQIQIYWSLLVWQSAGNTKSISNIQILGIMFRRKEYVTWETQKLHNMYDL
jgi:hypothetical protein